MPIPRIDAKDLLSAAEMELFHLSQSDAALRKSGPVQLRDEIARARNLRDRARALYRKQAGQTRAHTGTKRGFSGIDNERSRQKAQVLSEVVERLSEARTQQLSAA